MKFAGGCHCGRISVEFSTKLAAADLTPRACQCEFCKRHGAVYLSDPVGRVVLATTGFEADVYRFGLGITDFHVCQQCGVLVAASCQVDDVLLSAVNMRALEAAGSITTAPSIVDFGAEDGATREARRRIKWTPTLLRQ